MAKRIETNLKNDFIKDMGSTKTKLPKSSSKTVNLIRSITVKVKHGETEKPLPLII